MQLALTSETSKKRGSSSLERILKYVGTLYVKMKDRKGENCQTKRSISKVIAATLTVDSLLKMRY